MKRTAPADQPGMYGPCRQMSAQGQDEGLSTAALMAQVGANLRAARRSAGLSQEATAKAAGLHRTQIGLMEGGKRMPRLDTILKLAGAIEVEPGELFRGVRWIPYAASKAGRFSSAPEKRQPPG